MRLAWVQARMTTIELVRYPSFSVPTLLLPSLFFLVLGRRYSGSSPELVMALYAALALLAVAFFQFGVGIAAERVSPWSVFLRTLPAGASLRFSGRILSALAVGIVSAIPVVCLAVATTPARLDPAHWALLGGALLLGSVPFALLGIAIGYSFSPKGALPLANLLFLTLSYAGGLWTSAASLPGIVAGIAPAVPTRLWADLLSSAVGTRPLQPHTALALLGYAGVFGALAVAGYRRDEGERYA